MRKLVYSINMTADGCLDHTKVHGSDEILVFFADIVRNAGLLVYGRITYQLMVPYWPEIAKNQAGETKADLEFAEAFESVDKVVFSRTLEKVEDKKSRLVRTDLRDEILRLKKQEGKDILLGGVYLSSQLIALGLVDEYLFVVHPILAGDGRRLFEGVSLQTSLPLKLVDSMPLKSGCVVNRYVKSAD